MNCLIIKNGAVINAIVSTANEARIAYPDAICMDQYPAGVGVGWMYDGESFSPPPEPESPDPIPASCTRRQGLRALIFYGFMPSQIEALIEAIPDEVQRELTRVDYEAATWERADESLQAMWTSLGGKPVQLDDLFRLAVTLYPTCLCMFFYARR